MPFRRLGEHWPVLGRRGLGDGMFGGGGETIAPTVAIASSESVITKSNPFSVTITFSEEVTGFAVGDITVVNGAAGNFATADNIIFTADITPTGLGTVTVDISAGVCTDAAGNPNEAATQFSILYAYMWEFGTDYLAGNIPSPYSENNPVSLLITDTGSKLSTSSGKLHWTTRQGNDDPRLISAATIARANGLAFHIFADTNKYAGGFDTVNTRTPNISSVQRSANALSFFVSNLLGAVDLGDVLPFTSYYNLVVLLQSDGAYWFLKCASDGVDFPYWTLVYFSAYDATANLYYGLGVTNANPSQEVDIEDLRLSILAGGFEAAYGIATDYSATADALATQDMTADGFVVCTRQMATNDVFELSVRYTDDNNRIVVRCDQAGSTIKLIKIEGAAETELHSAAQTWTNGTSYRIGVRCFGYNFDTVVNDVVKNTASDPFNSSEITAKVSHAVTKWACFPAIAPTAFSDELDKLAYPYAPDSPTPGSGTYPAQGYIDSVMALSPDSYWPMQELYGLAVNDYTGNNQGGSFAAGLGITNNEDGLYGTSYHLSGITTAQFIPSAGLNSNFDFNEFTMCYWIKLEQNPATNFKLLEAWNNTVDEYFAIEMRNGNELSIFLREQEGDQNFLVCYIPDDDQWHHVAFFNSLLNGVAGAWLDGVLYSTVKTSVLGISGTNGAGYPNFGQFVEGNIQHRAHWNKLLLQAEIDTISS